MKICKTKIPNLYIIESFVDHDDRGSFIKVYNKSLFDKYHLKNNFSEIYYSISKQNVIRGMHFQVPPHDHEKLVFVTKGVALDVILDLRKKSKTYKHYLATELSSKNCKAIYAPKGCAHGFLSLRNNTIINYAVTSEYNSQTDRGVRWDSFSFDWRIKSPIISAKDNNLPALQQFKTPFV
jgi:dTDP-4-dehydrorhamnose 3,5-epimerase